MKRFLIFSVCVSLVFPALSFAKGTPGQDHGNARLGSQRVTLPPDLKGVKLPGKRVSDNGEVSFAEVRRIDEALKPLFHKCRNSDFPEQTRERLSAFC